MRSCSRVVAQASGGRTRLTHLRSDAPILLRPTPDALYLVAGAAGPLGGDDLRLELVVGAGAHLAVRSTGATVVLPGRSGDESHLTIDARVESGGSLSWLVEPTVLAAGCHHRGEVEIEAGTGAQVVWREELVLGRHLEKPGTAVNRLSCTAGGQPVLRTELRLGPATPGWDGPAVTGASKATGTLLVVHPALAGVPAGAQVLAANAAIMPLAGPAALASVLAGDTVELRRYLDAAGRILVQKPVERLSA